ncbi:MULTISPECIES: DUF4148 domain-containing protein [Paraburkholderia]|jgi:hypothetical protein|uniref:DUF4148 domain-containing protein n=1 Tax=Paraburkholderia caledonica TaxID=134536 RepID=A0AB73IC94_9BURK|nr:DUF4148 domain-containing protein [Paraburkholderia caledonica]MDP9647648.1 hypothetical protein [Paraburkholderia caledonica]MDR6375794.1 hypothetical protein [Paraburkholderia caledonica]CAH2900753.1 MAG: FIG00455683: hypothetical protein [uncultured Paraburkholderia sp.]CAH2929740.1 MAG: FIG00455683: hypothetical protein [uncultured Paraburkholderia sp.]
MKRTYADRAVSRSFIMMVASTALMITSTWAHAQASPSPGSHQLTRAEVMHELEELEAAGYNPSVGDDPNYPADIQEAERKVAAMHAAQQNASVDGQPAMQSMPAMPMQ